MCGLCRYFENRWNSSGLRGDDCSTRFSFGRRIHRRLPEPPNSRLALFAARLPLFV
jgi:hypothetical protein